MHYTIIIHPSIKKDVEDLDKALKTRLSKLMNRLEKEPWNTGKRLKYSRGLLREVYLGNYRVYFSISEEVVNIVAILAVTHKNEQRRTIERISLKIKKLLDDCVKIAKFK